MNRKQKLLATLTALFTAPAMAHVGPESASSHFFEHLLIALMVGVVGVAAAYALLRHHNK